MVGHTLSLCVSVKEFWHSFKDVEGYFRDTEGTLKLCLKLRESVRSFGIAVSSSMQCKILFMLPSCIFSLKEFLSLLNLSNKAAEDEKTEAVLESVR